MWRLMEPDRAHHISNLGDLQTSQFWKHRVAQREVAKDPNCVKNQTKRLFFRMPLPAIKGRYVQAVEFTAYETSAYDCNYDSSIELWRTSTLSSGATWSNATSSSVWSQQLAWRAVSYCSR
ncbi:hypothetical protein ETD83_42115, partial [Actinomadura soli]